MNPHRRGFMLYTMLIVLALLGVFSLVAGRLFISILRVTRSGQDIQTQTTRFDGLVRELRADVWGANQLQTTGGKLVITRPDQGIVTWQVTADQMVVRADSAQERRWAGLGADFVFEVRGAVAVLKVQDGPMKRSDEIVLISQMQRTGRDSQ